MIRNTKNREHESTIQIRRQSFQQEIRRARVQQIINAMRDELMTSNNQDYHILKKIDLNECFNEFNKVDLDKISHQLSRLDVLVLNMYSYCISNRSDHLYSIISDFTLEKMIRMLDWDLVDSYSSKPRVYVRLVWILSNYCVYANSAPKVYFEIIAKLLSNLLNKDSNIYQQKRDFLFFRHFQVKLIIQLIFWSLSQIQLKNQDCLDFYVDRFIAVALNESTKILKSLKHGQNYQKDTQLAILVLIIKMCQNFCSLTQFSQELQQKILDLDYQIVNNLLEVLSYAYIHNREIEISIADCFRSFFLAHLNTRPNILVSHRFQILFESFRAAAKNVVFLHSEIFGFHKKFEIEGETKKTLSQLERQLADAEYKLSRWLGVLVVIFGSNIPEDQNEKSCYQIQMNWVQNFVFPTFTQILKINQLKSREVMTKMMNILQNICLDQTLCEVLLNQLLIVNYIFYNCKSTQNRVDIRKLSLLCLVNIIKICMDNELKQQVLQLMHKNQIITVFVQNIAQFSQVNINESLLEGLKVMLDVEPCEVKQQNQVWIRFCEQGGKYKLEKLMQMSGEGWKDVGKFAENILKQFDDVQL